MVYILQRCMNKYSLFLECRVASELLAPFCQVKLQSDRFRTWSTPTDSSHSSLRKGPVEVETWLESSWRQWKSSAHSNIPPHSHPHSGSSKPSDRVWFPFPFGFSLPACSMLPLSLSFPCPPVPLPFSPLNNFVETNMPPIACPPCMHLI